MTDQRFPKRLRVLRPTEFDRVFAARASAGDALIVLHGAYNDLGHARLGLAVSRRVGNAVVRNGWKRRIREAFRLAQHDLPPVDLVCLPRAGAEPDVRRLRASLVVLARQVERRLRRKPSRKNDSTTR